MGTSFLFLVDDTSALVASFGEPRWSSRLPQFALLALLTTGVHRGARLRNVQLKLVFVPFSLPTFFAVKL